MTGTPISRRRALTILAGGAGALALGRVAHGTQVHEWRGTALGADARIVIAGQDADKARRMVALILDEVERLEDILSLYRDNSELVRLNRDGRLEAPSHDLRLVLDRALGYWERTGGAFNPAIQPLWRFLAAHFAATPDRAPDAQAIASRLALCDPAMIDAGPHVIGLAPGMALTFNGIAQGYITDRVAGILASEGARDILLGLGELRALPGRTWQIGIANTPGLVPLCGRAAATSAGAGTPFTGDLRWHHLIDAKSGLPANRFKSVTVVGDTACEADALSTALSASAHLEPAQIAGTFPGTQIIAVPADAAASDATAPGPGSASAQAGHALDLHQGESPAATARL